MTNLSINPEFISDNNTFTFRNVESMYNGFIEVESKLGKTTFSINIPIKEDNEYSNN